MPKAPAIHFSRDDMPTPQRLVKNWCKKHRTKMKEFASLVGISWDRLNRYLQKRSNPPLWVVYKITRIVSGTDRVDYVFPPDEFGVDLVEGGEKE